MSQPCSYGNSVHTQNPSKITLEWLLLARILRRHYLYLTCLEPDIQARVHAAGNVSEGHPLVNSILKEAHCAIPGIVQDSQPGDGLLTLAPVAENCA